MRSPELEILGDAREKDEPVPVCDRLTAPDEVVRVRTSAEPERFSRFTVAEKLAASSTAAPHEAGMGAFVMCRCDAGVFGIGMFGIGMLRCWQQACKFTEWQ